jgi:hypothetical protein
VNHQGSSSLTIKKMMEKLPLKTVMNYFAMFKGRLLCLKPIETRKMIMENLRSPRKSSGRTHFEQAARAPRITGPLTGPRGNRPIPMIPMLVKPHGQKITGGSRPWKKYLFW